VLDAYAGCGGNSAAVVVVQNTYLENARKEKEARHGKFILKIYIP
jgi:hypothetical protein